MLTYSNEEVLEVTFEDVKNEVLYQQLNDINVEMQSFCRGCADFYVNDERICGTDFQFNIEHDSQEGMYVLIEYTRYSDGMEIVYTLPTSMNSKIEIRRRNDNVVHIIM